MTPAALLQSVLASLPEIVVITGACVLLIVGLFVPKGRSHVLVWASIAIVAAAAAAMYLANTALVTVVVSLELKTNPFSFWWIGTKENGAAS